MGIIIPDVQMTELRLRGVGQGVVCGTDPGSEPGPKARPTLLSAWAELPPHVPSLESSEGHVWGWGGEGVEREGKEHTGGMHLSFLSFFCRLGSSLSSASLAYKLEAVTAPRTGS